MDEYSVHIHVNQRHAHTFYMCDMQITDGPRQIMLLKAMIVPFIK